jgi:seryl-tRNA synthetase
MNTYTITIGALALIGTGFSILLTLKYLTLKAYYKRKCQRHDALNEQLATANDMLKDLFAEDKRKNAKLLAKNQEIQKLKEPIEKQLCDLVQELKDYTIESGNVLGYDERTPIEFVNIFLNKTK